MAAMLVREGLPLVCDDTLVLAPSSGGPLAIPDAKPLKLWADTLELADMAATGPIHAVPGKHYCQPPARADHRSEEHTSELQSLMRISYAGFCLKKKKTTIARTEEAVCEHMTHMNIYYKEDLCIYI